MSAPGRSRRRLAAMLVEAINPLPDGVVFSITPDDLRRRHGPYPLGEDHVASWDGIGTLTWPSGSTASQPLGSYDTMRDCVATGISISWRGGRPFSGGIDVHATRSSR